MKFYNLKQIYRETDEIEKVFILAYIFSFSILFIYTQSLKSIFPLLAILFFSYPKSAVKPRHSGRGYKA